MPLNSWVAQIAKKMTIDISNGKILPNVKKALAALRPGATTVELNLHSGNTTTTIRLRDGVELGTTTASDLVALGARVGIE
jgi:hypothetical protein